MVDEIETAVEVISYCSPQYFEGKLYFKSYKPCGIRTIEQLGQGAHGVRQIRDSNIDTNLAIISTAVFNMYRFYRTGKG